MIPLLLITCLLQDPAPPPPAAQAPAPAAEVKPAPPPSSGEDRLERLVGGEAAPAAEPDVDAKLAQPQDPFASWPPLNSAALIVNEELVTQRDILRGAVRRAREQGRTSLTARQQEQMASEELNDRAKSMLEIQGGKDLGFDVEQVDRMVNRYMDMQTERAGGVTRLAEGLKREDKDSFARREDILAYVNTKLWTESVTGESPGPGGRVMRDNYVRPGRALFEYRKALKLQPKTRAVETTQLILTLGEPPFAPGAEERLQRRLEELRTRIENGEDMGELADQFGATKKGQRGRAPFLTISTVRKTNPEIGAYLETAKVGELSPVLPYRQEGRVFGYAVLRVEEFKLDKVENFDEPQGQLRCLAGLKVGLEENRINSGLNDLMAAAFVWPPQNFASSRPAP